MRFNDPNYRKSQLIRLEVISQLQASGQLDGQLQWRV
jgi:hypothetical protein